MQFNKGAMLCGVLLKLISFVGEPGRAMKNFNLASLFLDTTGLKLCFSSLSCFCFFI